MIKIVILFFCLFLDRTWGMDSVSVSDRIIALNLYHRDHVRGVFVLPKGKLTEEEIVSVYANLDRVLSYGDEKDFLRRNLLGIIGFLKRTNPRFATVCEQSTSNLLMLNAYTGLVIGQPVFSNVDCIQQHAMLYLTSGIFGNDLFLPVSTDSEQFLKDYSEKDISLEEALGEFMRKNGYDPRTVEMTLITERSLCAEHMLDHFINADDSPKKKISGYFVTSIFQDVIKNKRIAESIISVLFKSKMTRVIISQDRHEPSALIVYRNFIHGEVPGLGRVLAETPIIAFSSSVRGDVFFPTKWVKAIIRFKRSANGLLKISLVSVYPDAIGLSEKEALDFQKR